MQTRATPKCRSYCILPSPRRKWKRGSSGLSVLAAPAGPTLWGLCPPCSTDPRDASHLRAPSRDQSHRGGSGGVDVRPCPPPVQHLNNVASTSNLLRRRFMGRTPLEDGPWADWVPRRDAWRLGPFLRKESDEQLRFPLSGCSHWCPVSWWFRARCSWFFRTSGPYQVFAANGPPGTETTACPTPLNRLFSFFLAGSVLLLRRAKYAKTGGAGKKNILRPHASRDLRARVLAPYNSCHRVQTGPRRAYERIP
jgi:hypothetical protein